VDLRGRTSDKGFCFDARDAVTAVVPAAPVFDRYQAYFDVAVPVLAAAELSPPRPTMIVARVTAPVALGRKLAAGPRPRRAERAYRHCSSWRPKAGRQRMPRPRSTWAAR
jgi:hypothetical protein